MEMKLLQPKNCDFSKIKKEFVQTPEKIITKVTYPSGVVLVFEQTADQINVSSSKPLIQVSENVYQIPD